MRRGIIWRIDHMAKGKPVKATEKPANASTTTPAPVLPELQQQQHKPCTVHIRWMIRRDMPEVLEIEKATFRDDAWQEEDFLRSLRQNNIIGMVADYDGAIIGYMLYQLHKHRFELLTLVTCPVWRNRGVGSQMVDKMIAKMSNMRRHRLDIEVSEMNLKALKFLAKRGFRAVGVLRNGWRCGERDAYQMRWALGLESCSLENVESESNEERD